MVETCVRIRVRIEIFVRNGLEGIESHSEWVGFIRIRHRIEKDESLFRLVWDSFGLVSDSIIQFDVGFIRIEIWRLSDWKELKHLSGWGSDSFGFNLEFAHGLKRIYNFLLIRSEWNCLVRVQISEWFRNIRQGNSILLREMVALIEYSLFKYVRWRRELRRNSAKLGRFEPLIAYKTIQKDYNLFILMNNCKFGYPTVQISSYLFFVNLHNLYFTPHFFFALQSSLWSFFWDGLG